MTTIDHIAQVLTNLEAAELQNTRLRAENAKLREALDDAGDRLFEHHNTSYRPEAGEICTICTKSGNIFERIDALLKPADRATGHGSADGDDDD